MIQRYPWLQSEDVSFSGYLFHVDTKNLLQFLAQFSS